MFHLVTFSGPAYPLSGSYFGPAAADVPIWLDNVDCAPGTTNLAYCHHRPVGENNCQHVSEDAGVVCNCELSLFVSCTKVTVTVMVCRFIPGKACSDDATPWLDLYIPAPSPLPREHYTNVIIDAG